MARFMRNWPFMASIAASAWAHGLTRQNGPTRQRPQGQHPPTRGAEGVVGGEANAERQRPQRQRPPTRGLEGVVGDEAKALGGARLGIAHDLGRVDNHAKGGEGVVQQLRGAAQHSAAAQAVRSGCWRLARQAAGLPAQSCQPALPFHPRHLWRLPGATSCSLRAANATNCTKLQNCRRQSLQGSRVFDRAAERRPPRHPQVPGPMRPPAHLLISSVPLIPPKP